MKDKLYKLYFTNLRFNGESYVPTLDRERLTGQRRRVYAAMLDGKWRTLGEIAAITNDPEASISAQLRHLRKPRFGSYTIEKRRHGQESRGLWEYRISP